MNASDETIEQVLRLVRQLPESIRGEFAPQPPPRAWRDALDEMSRAELQGAFVEVMCRLLMDG